VGASRLWWNKADYGGKNRLWWEKMATGIRGLRLDVWRPSPKQEPFVTKHEDGRPPRGYPGCAVCTAS